MSTSIKTKNKEKEEEDKKEVNKEIKLKGPSDKLFIKTQLVKNMKHKEDIDYLNKFIVNENFIKIDYSLLDPLKNEMTALMKGKYSSLRPGIAYINPKVNEPHDLIPGRPPRKVMIDRMKKIYLTINIETLLKNINIDFSKIDPLESWLPLEFFEDKDLDIYKPEEWLQKASDDYRSVLYIPGVALHRDTNGIGTWRRVLINSYEKASDKFSGIWDGTEERCIISKIYLLFDAENPFLFAKKVSLATTEREKAESIIRYNFYIDKMVLENLIDITEDQKIRLRKGIERIPYLKIEPKYIDDLFKELNLNYLRTTNKIIFDKFYNSRKKKKLIINDLKLTDSGLSGYNDENTPEIVNGELVSKVRYLGLEYVPPYKYIESYKNFTFKTLLCRKEIIDCLQKIRDECNKIKDNFNIYNLGIHKPLRLQEFKQIQKSSIFQLGKKLEFEWIKTIKETLERSLNGVGKGSFNLNVASKEIYEYLKLKKYMTVVKSIMQDTLYTLVTKSMVSYVEFIEKFIPEEVIVEDVNEVKNLFPLIAEERPEILNDTYDLIRMDDAQNNNILENNILDDDDFLNDIDGKKPLFQINITKREDRRVEYTTKAEELIEEIMKIFDEGLEKMQQIPQVEPLLLSNLIKKAEKQKIPLKSIVRPKTGKPKPVDKDQIKYGYELNDDAIWIWELFDRLKDSLTRACDPLKAYLETFKKFKEDLGLDPIDYLRKIKEDNNQNWTYQKIRDDINSNKCKEKSLLSQIPQIIHVSIFQINCKEFRTDLSSKFSKIAEMEIEYLKEKSADINKEILNNYSSMKKEIMMEVNSIADLVKVQNYIETIPNEIAKLREKTAEVDEIYNILDGFNVCIDHIQTDFKLALVGGPTDIENTIRSVNLILDKKKEKLYEEQIENQGKLLEEYDILCGNVNDFENYYKEENKKEAVKLAFYVHDKLKEIIAQAQTYNEREQLFLKPLTNYSIIYDLKAKFDPYFWLWSSIDKWDDKLSHWFNDNFSKLKGDDIETTILELNKDLKNALTRFRDREVNEKIIELCQVYKAEVESFKPKGDLALALTKGLSERHWMELNDRTKINCTPRDGFTFKNIVDAGMMKYLEICQEIGEKAAKENAINEQMENIEKKWREICFTLMSHKTTKIPNIANWNDVNKELDNDIMEIQQLEISPFKGPYGDKISMWNKELLNISLVLEEWFKCQKNWIYLQPVFDSGDIAKDIPNEHKKFMMTDRMWRDLMISVEKNLNVRSCCAKEGLLEKLREANMNLENVEKGLNQYMEKKREIFPRFYFISNAQFLEILSQTKDIKKVKDNLNKIFESINNIELREDRYIVNFISNIGECLNMENAIDIQRKNVEIWMREVEETIFKTVRAYLERCLQDYGKGLRKDWVKTHPGQCTMAGNQVMFTTEVENAIKTNTLPQYLKEYENKILELVSFAREKQTRLLSINLSNLLTIDVHNKNILNLLIKNNVKTINAFDWIMQLRYYWESDYAGKYDCQVKSVQTDFPYGYEYIGNAEILVITPLTDKCYLTLMGALRLNLGGAPAGPAGTGKTESTKDLARSLAKLCVVYNCSEDTDYLMIGKFFKGLACCGAWICFDEFNRINIEVLSVIATQLLQLFGSKEKGERITVFEGSTIKILPTFCVFITMNPGYAGRTELPDNLKALFRPIAMMVPDYRLIAEINLYSAGYVQANDLATKVVSTMKLSSEQLSTQGHYDFGMRAVKSVLNAARRLKRIETEKAEDQLLLRALEDVNVPKFTQEDIPLFRNIITDLFPTTTRPQIDYNDLLEKINISCSNHNILPTNSFVQKIIQLYDTIQVRHGLMLVGPAGGGKTMNYSVLKDSLTMLDDGQRYFKTVTNIINPKAIKHSEIYSEQDPNTMEWSFGVLPLIINECKRDTELKTKYWLIFDGPVDAMWIEDMNSVLDDSKKLCLASSDIIVLNEMITLMFEVEDLVVASPATVSRCGMVFMEPSALGLSPLVECWLKKLNDIFNPQDTKILNMLQSLFKSYLEDCVFFVRKKLKELTPTVDNNLASSAMKIVDTFFDKFRTPEYKAKKKNLDDFREMESHLEALFNYAMVWSLGVTTNEEGRKKFDLFFREQMKAKSIDKNSIIPDEGSVYDYMYDTEKGSWVLWTSLLGNYEIPLGISYNEIIVPTPDSVRYTYLTKLLVKSHKHIITSGPTGTGKTVNIIELITRGLTEKYMPIIINFSAQTTSKQTQDTLESKVRKKVRNRYAPDNNKIGLIFVDDLNMPIRQDSGAQPPIELLRQWLDHQGWYELKGKTFIIIENMVILAAMGPPGGARSQLSQRFQRHFNLLTYNELEDSSIKLIFNTIVKNLLNRFPEEIKEQVPNLVSSVLKLYKEIRLTMLPTPKKMHYIFNLRDMSKVLGGICSASIKYVLTKTDITRLYVHEVTRVFGDRFINDEDKDWLNQQLNKDCTGIFNEKLEDIYKYGKKIIFCDFIYQDHYAQVSDITAFIKKINQYLEQYNDSTKKKQLKLVMFLDACDHVCRICRILKQPQGNALLLGVGGSGRQSLARLATYINSYDSYQIEVIKGYTMIDFKKNVKECLKMTGIKETKVSFLIVDTQLIYPLMLEYINNILNSGDVPNIYKKDDLEEISAAVKNEVLMKFGNMQESNVMKVYLSRVLKNIHVVLAMSPVGNSFVANLRMFPSLVNCCTLDWFTDWPEDALESVALDSLNKENLALDNYINQVVSAFKFIHKKVESESREYSSQMKRFVYLTPTSYLELLNLYQRILKAKRNEISKSITRFANGLTVLRDARVQVDHMSKEISLKQPELKENQEKTRQLLEVLKVEKEKASEDEREATIKKEAADKFEEECKQFLDEANHQLELVRPLIKEAVESVNKVKKTDLDNIKKINNQSKPVENLLEGLLIFKLGNSWKTKEFLNKNPSPEKNPYLIKEALIKNLNFNDTEGFLNDLKLMCTEENLKIFKVTHFDYMKILEEFFLERGVTREVCMKGAGVIVGLFEFMEKIIKYVDNSVNKIDPILIKLEKAKVEMTIAVQSKEEALAKKMKAVEIVERLDNQYREANEKEQQLKKDLDDASMKLERANSLITLLSGEQVRWEECVEDLKKRLLNLIGDCLIAAGSISYCGPFTYEYRMRLENAWRKKIKELNIIHTPEISMKDLLEDKVEAREWTVNGLPQDNLSLENAIIMKYTRRWPLMIDPQNQGSSFIKKYGKRKDMIDVVKASDPNFLNAIIGAIRLCKWVLLENVGINIDPSLEPILNQQVVERPGGFKDIKIGDNTIPWSDQFKLYISTTIPNPHYSPETFVKVTIINFGITPTGLEEQMMTLLINNEMPELEQRKNAILMENFMSMNELREAEDKILSSLSGGGGEGGKGDISEFLNSDTLILNLKEAKTKSEEITQKLKESEETSKQIDTKRELYRPAALRASLLFFATIDLSSIDPMYQFSLQWFSKLYENSIKITPPSNNLDTRIFNINRKFTYILFENVCRSLFEKDKLLFSFVICHKIITGEVVKDPKLKISQTEWRYLLAGPIGEIQIPTNPTKWISKNEWNLFYRQLYYMSEHFDCTKGIEPYFMKNHNKFKEIYDSANAHTDPLPEQWSEKITDFMRLAIVKMIRPDKFIAALQLWIEKNLGKEFIEGTAFSLQKTFKESSNIVPLIFILSPGSDPINDIKNFAEEAGFTKRFDYVSLGRGQEKKALDRLDEMRTKGGWVLLQNCHLAKSFMGKLEEIVENFDTNWPDKDFRLWLTSMSNDKFPVSILQNSLKITVEPPKGLKNNLMRTYNKLENKDLEDCFKKDEYKSLIFGLSFFHAVLQDRRKYGPIGWNVKYDFTNEDWMVCKKQLKIFLEQYEGIPYQVLDYLIGDINYGGRVTDDKDQRLIKTILKTYLNPNLFLYTDYKFSKSGIYYSPAPGEHENYMNYILALPVNSEPEVFGLHENADIVTAQNESYALLETVLSIQPRVSGGSGQSMESLIIGILEEIEKKLPPGFDKDEIFNDFHTDYNESMNTVLLQETIRYNVLISTMKKSIKNLKKALTGKIVMSEEMEKMAGSLFINQVPELWSKVFLSLKPLSSWSIDLTKRIEFFTNWIQSKKTPPSFWISAFSFPQAFLTAALQNYARKNKVAIDLLTFEYKILDNMNTADIKQAPESGVYCYGMFLEGARWNFETHLLDDSKPKELYTDVPIIHFLPVPNRELPTSKVYFCPLYKVLSRAGTLSTTGHSTNYVLFVELPTDDDQGVWVKAGVAMFLALKQ